jgi:hypothetical protein
MLGYLRIITNLLSFAYNTQNYTRHIQFYQRDIFSNFLIVTIRGHRII